MNSTNIPLPQSQRFCEAKLMDKIDRNTTSQSTSKASTVTNQKWTKTIKSQANHHT